MANNPRHILGTYGELVAADFLSNQGYEIIERNWRCRQGEIDIVARERNSWVFVEVKTRSSASSDLGLEAVDELKIQKLRRAISQWCQDRQVASINLRIDVVSVFVHAGKVSFEHLKQVF
jgi:putative endonuclease